MKLRTATAKHSALVQKLWTMRLPCGRLRKTEKELVPDARVAPPLQTRVRKSHKQRSFQEEFVAFLKKNNVAYDERHIWD
jgi:hypothetical protein